MPERNCALGTWIKRFLMEYLPTERNLAINTRKSYRDCLTLLLPFVAGRRGKPVERLTVEDLSADRVRAFLGYLEQERGCSVQTRNLRLTAIRSFARYVAVRDAALVEWAGTIRAIPLKKNGAAADRLAVSGEYGRHDHQAGPAHRNRAGRARPPAFPLQHWGESLRGGGTAGRRSPSPGTHGRKRACNDPWQGRKEPHHSDVDEHRQGPRRSLQRPPTRLRGASSGAGIANPTPAMASSNSWSVPPPACLNSPGKR